MTNPALDLSYLAPGKRSRLAALLARNKGRLAVLPIDQGLEHGPVDFLDAPDAANPEHEFRMVAEAGFSAIAVQIGLAEKYLPKYAEQVPLILKINGKTSVPPDDDAFSPLTATVEDAVRLGALAVGYTLYVGSPRQDDDFLQFEEVRREAERCGMPVIVWAYPRGSAIEAKGGKESPYAVEYAARAAMEVGADVVKVNIPKYDAKKAERYPAPYREIGRDAREAMSRVVKNVGRTLVIASGGSRLSAEEAVAQAKLALEAGCAGLIFGRNVWQRPYGEGLEVARELIKVVRGEA